MNPSFFGGGGSFAMLGVNHSVAGGWLTREVAKEGGDSIIVTCCWISHIWLSRPALPGTGAGAQEDRQRQPRSSVCSDCAQLFPMMSVDWGMCSLVVAPRAGFGRVRFRVEPARRPCATPSSGRSRVHDADPTYRAGFSRRSTPPHALRALRPAPCTATPCPLRLRTLSCTCSSF